MKREPLFPHVSKRREPLFPHRPKSSKLPATTYTAEQIFARAKSLFGTTTIPDEAGYILPDGTMLDFSGRHYEPTAPISGPFKERMADHREIAFAWPEDDSPGGLDAMAQVMNWGAVRFSTFNETVVVNLAKPPTEAQKRTIDRALRLNPDAVLIVEVDNAELDQIDFQDFTHPFSNWQAFVQRTIALGHPTGLGQRTKVGLLPQTSTAMSKEEFYDWYAESMRRRGERAPYVPEAIEYAKDITDDQVDELYKEVTRKPTATRTLKGVTFYLSSVLSARAATENLRAALRGIKVDEL